MKNILCNLSRLLILGVPLLLVGCAQIGPPATPLPSDTLLTAFPSLSTQTPLPLPSNTPAPTETLTPTPTDTLTPTPAIIFPLLLGTPLPFTPEPIAYDNTSRMVELARWEFAQPIKPYSIFTDPVYPNGVMAFSADSASLFVVTAQKDDSAFSALGGGTCFFFEYDFICPPDEGESGHIPCGTVGINRVHLTDGALMEYLPIELTSEPVKWLLSPAGDVLAEFSVAYGCPINLRVLSDSLTGLQITPNIAPFSQGYTDNSLLWIANDQGDVAKYSADMSGFSPAVHLDWKPAASELDGWKANYEDTLVSEDGYGFEAIAMSPYGKYLLTMISNGGSGKVTTQYGVHFSPDGEVMIYLWNLAGNKHVGGFREPLLEWWGSPGSYHPRGVSSAFSPDEKQLAIYQASLPVRVYDPSNGRLISAFGSPDAGYTGLVYTPDSRVLIVVGKFTVELWDPVRGEQLSTLAATGVIENFAISQDGRYLAALTHQGIIQIWGIAP